MSCFINVIFILIESFNNLLMNVDHFLQDYINVNFLFSILSILASLFIPIAVIFFEQVNNDNNKQYPLLDRKIIFGKILKAGRLYIIILTSCLLLLLWKNEYFRIVSATVFLVAIIVISISMINIYHWLKNDFSQGQKSKKVPFQDKKRLEYLIQNNNEGESVDLWNEVWHNIKGSTQYITDYLEAYTSSVRRFSDEFYYDTKQAFLRSLEDNNYCLNNSFQEALIKFTVPSSDNKNTLLIVDLRNYAISKIIHKFLCDDAYAHLQVFHYALNEKYSYNGIENHIFPAIYGYFDSIKDAYKNKTLKPTRTSFLPEKDIKKKTTLDYIFDAFSNPLLHGIDRLYYSLPTDHTPDTNSKPTFGAKCVYDTYRQWIMNEIFRSSYDKPGYDTQELYRIITRTACSKIVVNYNYLDDCIYIPYFLYEIDQLDPKNIANGIKNIIDHSFGYLPYADIDNPINKKIPSSLIYMGYNYNLTNVKLIKRAVNSFNYKKYKYNVCNEDEAHINLIMLKRILNQS